MADLPSGSDPMAGAPSGISSPVAIGSVIALNDRMTLTPNRPLVFREFAVEISPATTFARDFELFVPSVSRASVLIRCVVAVGETKCVDNGPSPVIPAASPVYLLTFSNGPSPAGTDVMFGYRVTEP